MSNLIRVVFDYAINKKEESIGEICVKYSEKNIKVHVKKIFIFSTFFIILKIKAKIKIMIFNLIEFLVLRLHCANY